MRLELLDAISEGENALAAVRVTVKDTELLEKYGIERLAFLNIEGSFFDSGSSSVSWTYPVDDHSLDNNQYLMIIGSSQNEADTKRECDITFRDLGLVEYTGENESVRKETVLLSGSWTLRMTLHFDGGIVAAENQTLRLPEMTLTVKEVRISALSLSMSICGGEEADTDALFDLLADLVQVHVARDQLRERIGDADDRPAELFLAHAVGAPEASGSGHPTTGRRHGASEWMFHGCPFVFNSRFPAAARFPQVRLRSFGLTKTAPFFRVSLLNGEALLSGEKGFVYSYTYKPPFSRHDSVTTSSKLMTWIYVWFNVCMYRIRLLVTKQK